MRPHFWLFLFLTAGLGSMTACAPRASALVAKSEIPRDVHPTVTESELRDLVASNNRFALDLYQSSAADDKNFIASPYSISTSLAMVYAGARGETEAEMARVLHYDLPQESLHAALNQLDLSLQPGGSLPKGERRLQLRTANAVWAEKDLELLQSYLDLLARDYGTGIRLADFVGNYASARQQINAWVDQQTNSRIHDLIPEGALSSSTRMVLVNAIYFDADWQAPFDPADTESAPFHLLDGSDVMARMMHNHLSAPFMQGDGFSAVELGYQGGTAVMDLFVPNEGAFRAFEASLTADKMDEIVMSMQPSDLDIALPKFKFSLRLDLKDALAGMGLPQAFDPGRADFSGMTGGRDLYIDKVLHEAFVAVDEQGTEAAAATSVIMAPTSALLPGSSLVIDRPFIFLIRDSSSGQILFVGRVTDPTK